MKFFITSKISENIAETPEGYLVCTGVAIARTGEMIYGHGETPLEPGPDGRVIVSRESEDVFRPETMASFEGKAVTILHPSDFVSPENWSQLAKGVIQNVRRGTGEQENDLIADLLITDSSAIEMVKSGLREVSCGYEAEYIQAGVGRGFQKNIVGNHIALVREGRAGASYAINDHKGKGSKMSVKDKIAAIFSKAKDEAMKAAEDENTETPEKKEGFVSHDDLNKAMKGMDDKLEAVMGKKEGKDKSTPPTQNEPAKVDAKDEEEAPAEQEKEDSAMSALSSRLEKLEAAVAKMLEAKATDADEDMSEEMGDDEDGDMDETDDAYGEEGCETGDAALDDTASRVEILAPGLKVGKDAKVKALVAAYATTDGKSVIEKFTGGKAPNFKDAALVDVMFIGASELLKVKRNSELAGTKTRDFKSENSKAKHPTAEQINEKNAKHYGPKH